jgi:hypothetical protein
MAPRKRNKRPAPRVSRAAELGENAYALALDMLQRLTVERDVQVGRVEFLAKGLEHANKQLEHSRSQLAGSQLALKLAEEERARFERERDHYATKWPLTFGTEEKQRAEGLAESESE